MHMYEIQKDGNEILNAGQQKRHRYKEQTIGQCPRRQGWDDMREQH